LTSFAGNFISSVACLQQTSSNVGLERILTPISSLAGWIIVVAGVLSSVQVNFKLAACMLH